MTETARRRRRTGTMQPSKERVVLQVTYVIALIIVGLMATLLRVRGDLDNTTVGVILGTIIGSIGTMASQRAPARHNDDRQAS